MYVIILVWKSLTKKTWHPTLNLTVLLNIFLIPELHEHSILIS